LIRTDFHVRDRRVRRESIRTSVRCHPKTTEWFGTGWHQPKSAIVESARYNFTEARLLASSDKVETGRTQSTFRLAWPAAPGTVDTCPRVRASCRNVNRA
jgi:hypothetical protein